MPIAPAMPLAPLWIPALLLASSSAAHQLARATTPTAPVPVSPAWQPAGPAGTFALAAASTPDPEREYAKGKEEAQAAMLGALEEFAAWCQKEKCLAQRNHAYEVVITIDPDHKLARKCLKYKRDRGTNEWTRKRKYKEPKAGKPEALAEAATRWAKVSEPYVAALLGLLKTHGELLKPSFVQEELDALLALAPENAALRERLGYVWAEAAAEAGAEVGAEPGGKGQWMLEETLYAKAERARIAGLLTELREEDPKISEGKLEDAETKWGIEWATPIKSKKLRVVVDSAIEDGEQEARRLIENMNSSWSLFAQLTGSKSKSPKAYTVYLVSGDTKIPGIIEKHSDFDDSDKEAYRGIYEYTDSLPLNPSSIVCYRESAAHRLDTAISEWVDFYLLSTYGVSFVRGWANVGMRHYVTELILGTRMTMPDGSDATPEMQKAGREGTLPDAIPAARKAMTKAKARYVRDLIETATYSMDDDDIHASYALFAYVIEGYDAEVSHKLLRNVARSADLRSADAFEKSLSMPIEAVQRRFVTWLDEIESLPSTRSSAKPKEASAKKER